MAKVKLNAIISSISGKVGGTIFQRTASGVVMKNSPYLPFTSSELQNNVNQYMYRCQYNWQQLTDNQRQTWKSFANFVKRSQHREKNVFLNGHQLFLQCNFYRYQYGYSTLTSPQFVRNELINITGTLYLQFGQFYFGTDRIMNNTNEFIILQITGKVSSTLNNPGSRYRSIIFTTTNINFWFITAIYKQVFGFTPVAGDRLFYKYALADKRTGIIYPFQTKVVTLT